MELTIEIAKEIMGRHECNLCIEYSFIEKLPDGLKVDGDLRLCGNQIKELPKGLFVGGDCFLSFTGIRSIPSDIEIGNNLYIMFTNIIEVPSIKIGGNIITTNEVNVPDKMKQKIKSYI